MSTAKDIAMRLAERAMDVACYLYPQGKHKSNHWVVGSIDGEPGQSLKICLQGRWADFATDHHGDLIDLWQLQRNISCAEAIKEAKQWLGMPEMEFVAYRPPKFNKPKTNFNEITTSSAVYDYLQNQRCLNAQVISAFHIAEKDNFIVFPYYHKEQVLMIKHLHIEREKGKKKIFVEPDGQRCLFGWQVIDDAAREITLTEGELDAMSLYQYGITALSLPFGGGAGNKHRWIDFEFERLAIFDKIYLCFDNDEVGQQTITAVIDRLGRHRCYVVTLPEKDANACLQKGLSKSVIDDCYRQARTLDPAELKSAREYLDKVINLFYPTDTVMQG